jgi:hypothetical protein
MFTKQTKVSGKHLTGIIANGIFSVYQIKGKPIGLSLNEYSIDSLIKELQEIQKQMEEK